MQSDPQHTSCCGPPFSRHPYKLWFLLDPSCLRAVCTHRELTSLMTKSEGLHGGIVYDRNPEAGDSGDDDD